MELQGGLHSFPGALGGLPGQMRLKLYSAVGKALSWCTGLGRATEQISKLPGLIVWDQLGV